MAQIGVDFGSSYTTVSWINPKTNKPEIVKFNGDGSVKMPSHILGTDSGLIMGFAASHYLEDINRLPFPEKMEAMSNFVPCLKRILKTDGIEYLNGRQYTHLQLLEIFFKFILKCVKEHCGSSYNIDSVAFSHPVNFEHSNIQMISKAFENIGLRVDEIIMEPVAAVRGYEIEHVINDNEGILVFDFGGGTVDVAYVQKLYGELKLTVEPKGNNACGGKDIDLLIYNDLKKKIQEKYNVNISANGIIDHSIMESCKRLKEYFSGDNDSYSTTVAVVTPDRFFNYNYSLIRESFNSIIYPKVDEAIQLARNVIADIKSRGKQINRILLIGGSSQLTLVRELLQGIVENCDIDTFGEKDIAVALGNICTAWQKTIKAEEAKTTSVTTQQPTEVKKIPPLKREKSIICPKCKSANCFKQDGKVGYYCIDCTWEGLNIKVTYKF